MKTSFDNSRISSLGRSAGMVPIELLDRFDRRQTRQPQQGRPLPLLSRRRLAGSWHRLQELIVDGQRMLEALHRQDDLGEDRRLCHQRRGRSKAPRSSTKRCAGTAPVVPCTRRLATSSSQRRTATLAAAASRRSPEAAMLAASGLKEASFEIAMETPSP